MSEHDSLARLPEPPAPSRRARNAALAAALRRFDTKHGTAPQGFASSLRLTDETAMPPSRRSSFMFMPRARHFAAASLVALMAGSVAVVQFADRTGVSNRVAPDSTLDAKSGSESNTSNVKDNSKSVDFSRLEISKVEPPDRLRLTEKEKADVRAAPPAPVEQQTAERPVLTDREAGQAVAKLAPEVRVDRPVDVRSQERGRPRARGARQEPGARPAARRRARRAVGLEGAR